MYSKSDDRSSQLNPLLLVPGIKTWHPIDLLVIERNNKQAINTFSDENTVPDVIINTYTTQFVSSSRSSEDDEW